MRDSTHFVKQITFGVLISYVTNVVGHSAVHTSRHLTGSTTLTILRVPFAPRSLEPKTAITSMMGKYIAITITRPNLLSAAMGAILLF